MERDSNLNDDDEEREEEFPLWKEGVELVSSQEEERKESDFECKRRKDEEEKGAEKANGPSISSSFPTTFPPQPSSHSIPYFFNSSVNKKILKPFIPLKTEPRDSHE